MEFLGPPISNTVLGGAIKLDLANNKIVVNVPAHDLVGIPLRTGLEYFLEVWIPESYQSSNYVLLDTLEAREKPKETLGALSVYPGAFFEVDSLLRGILKTCVPTFEQKTISVCNGMITPYYCKSIVKNNGTTVNTTTYTSRYAIKSGIAERDYAAYHETFFDKYIGDGKRFLTYKPNRSVVTNTQPEYLHFLTNYSNSVTKLILKLTVRKETGGIVETTPLLLDGVVSMQIYCIPVGMLALGITDATEYSVCLLNQNNERVSEIRTYIVEQRYRRFERHFIFENSLGVYDSFISFGEAEENVSVSQQSGEQFIGYDYAAESSETVITERASTRELKVAFGWSSKRVADYLTDFLYSRAIFYQNDRSLLALECVSDKFTIADKEDWAGVVLSLRFSQKESNYSDLPTPSAAVTRPTGWRVLTTACQLDQRGRRNGMVNVLTLEKYYLDNNSLFLPRTVKENVVGQEGYLAPGVSGSCTVGSTPFLSAAISRSGTFVRSNCGSTLVGGYATIAIAAGAWGSTVSQADADAKAEAEWQSLNTQTYADTNGTCSAFPWLYAVPGGVPSGRFWVKFQTIDPVLTNNSGISNYNFSGGNDYRPGNMWVNQPGLQTNQTDVFAPNTWDVSFPTSVPYIFFLYLHSNGSTVRTLKYYINGILKQTVTSNQWNTDVYLTQQPVSGDRVFFSLE